jgi:RHS repeat-associated protein
VYNVFENPYEDTDEESEFTDDEILYEAEEKREANVKHFKLKDGRMAAMIYNTDVHEKDENGNWVEINNSLTEGQDETSEPSLSKDTGNVKVSFAKKAKEGKLLTIREGDYKIKWSLDGVNKKEASVKKENGEENKKKTEAKSISDTVVYENILDDVDLEYTLYGNDIKENIIVNKRTAAQSFSFTLSAGNNITASLEENKIFLKDKQSGEVVRVIEAPYMEDAEHEVSSALSLSLEKYRNIYTVTITPDMEWLLSSERAYPVVIDPTITQVYDNSTVDNTSVNSNNASSNAMYQYGALYVGRESSSYGHLRSAFKFTLPSGITESDMILSAYARLTVKQFSGSSGFTINAHQITANIPLINMNWWDLNSNYSSTVLDSVAIPAAQNQVRFYWDITDAVKSWYLNNNNYGLALISPDTANSYKYVQFFSSRYTGATVNRRPAASITYLNNEGLEGQLTYQTAGNGSMGTVNVGDFNGNLIYVYDDLTMDGNHMPISISHVYNHSKRGTENPAGQGKLGYGMRLNLSQRIQTSDVSGYTYKHTDADGTVHYYQASASGGSLHEKEFDTSTTIKVESDGTYTLSDGGDTEVKFNSSGYLTGITDKLTSKSLTVGYTGDKITSVTDGVGRTATLAYDANDYLTSVTDPSGRATSYSYTDGYLSSITRPNGEIVSITWSADGSKKIMTEITDADGSSLGVEYKAASPRRVSKITEYGTQGGEGNTLTWTYNSGETTITDRLGRSETMMFDNSGHTVCARDHLGNAVYSGFDNGNDNKKHALKYQSKMQKSVTNYIQNSGLELGSGTAWVSSYAGTAGSAGVNVDEHSLGQKSLKLTSSANTEIVSAYQTVSETQKGQTYTLSADVKAVNVAQGSTPGDSGFALAVICQDENGNETQMLGEQVKGTFDWQRMCYTFTIPSNSASDTIKAVVTLRNVVGEVYIDNVQLEEGDVANRYNLLDNGHFREAVDSATASSWVKTGLASSDKVVAGRVGSGFYMAGQRTAAKSIEQTVTVSGAAGDNFVFGAWAMANAIMKTDLNNGAARTYGVKLTFVPTESGVTAQNFTFDFEAKTPNWQYLSGSASAPYAYSQVKIALLYERQANRAIFDDIQLYKEAFGGKMEYDTFGRLTTATDAEGRTTTYTYLEDKRPEVSSITYPDGTSTTYTYDSTTKQLLSVTDINGKTATYSYDEDGLATGVSTSADGLTMTSGVIEYSTNYKSSYTDMFGNETLYNYNDLKGVLNTVTDVNGNETDYTYNADNDNLLAVSTGNSTNTYTYDDGRLDTISHNTTGSTPDVTYTFEYDQFGNVTSTSVGNQVLAANTYGANNGYLEMTEYGNGDYSEPTYDEAGRITSMSYDGVDAYRWSYTSDGRIGRYDDLISGVYWRYEYDSDGTPVKAYSSEGDMLTYVYDKTTGRLTSTKTTSEGVTKGNVYTYSNTGTLTDMELSDGKKISYSIDGFDRVSQTDISAEGETPIYTTEYQYRNGEAAQTTSSVVSQIINSGVNWSETLSYTYDALGNIETISEGDTQKAQYYYDELNQLIREDNAWLGKTIAYTYDNGGNILLVEEYTLTSGALDGLTATNSYTYLYGDSNWKDKLTSYDGKAITYDSIGNRTNYDGYTYTWQRGRQLAGISGNGLTASYTYDSNGVRTGKTVNGVEHTYLLNGTKVLKEVAGEDILWYDYDAAGNILSMTLNGDTYYYEKNVQGDIIGIIDGDGAKVVSYLYDSWGKLISTTGSLADTVGVKNPYRYRGYRYDTETGLYYLQSRYYDASIGRFVNADGLVHTGQGVLGNDMYTYCLNNPVNMIDPSGRISFRADGSPIINSLKDYYDFLDYMGIVIMYVNSLPTKDGPANSKVTLNYPDGTPKQDRWYDGDGRAIKDYDYDDHGKPKKHPHDENGGHYHDWDWSVNPNGDRSSPYIEEIGWDIDWGVVAESALGAVLIVGCVVGMAIIIADNATGVGIGDDVLLPPLVAGFEKGLSMVFG